ncbi:MAG: TSUP family transporter [Azoarcus sp.]|jgi:uncharacterized membrane protein YfcA|nr:TSUP family transporter [Azoarcus sp.]
MPIDALSLLILGLAAFGAGCIDALVGGGGLIQVPVLFSVFPSTMPATLFGTNKLAAVFGTLSAAVQYGRRIAIPWALVLPGTLAALVGSWMGARTVNWISPLVLRPMILVLLIAVAVYTFARREFGTHAHARFSGFRAVCIAFTIGGTVGFYDGFFGPGTGSFLIFLFVRFLGMDFLHASASAKIVNVATNFAALAYFIPNVTLLWATAGVMMACNLAGALFGSHLALRHGVRFIRIIFLCVVIALIAKLGVDTLVTNA